MHTVKFEGYPYEQNEFTSPFIDYVAPGHFATMGMAVVAGREFNDRDAEGQPVVIINEATAERYFEGRNPLGQVRKRPEKRAVGGKLDQLHGDLVGDTFHEDPGRRNVGPAAFFGERDGLVDDVIDLAEPILKHRMALTFAARAEGVRLHNVIESLAEQLE